MIDGVTPEDVSQPLGSVRSVVESQGADSAPVPESASLKEKYTRHAKRYRELGQKQLNSSLTDGERIECEGLRRMAGFGMFEANLSDDQLKAKDAAYQASIEVEPKELVNPQASAERYRILGKKLIDVGLTPDELAEYNRLEVYAKRGKLELPNVA